MNIKTNIYYLFIILFIFKSFTNAFKCAFNGIDYSPLSLNSPGERYHYSFRDNNGNFNYLYMDICKSCNGYCEKGYDAAIYYYINKKQEKYNIAGTNTGTFKSNDGSVSLTYITENSCPYGSSTTLIINFIPISYLSSDAYISNVTKISQCVYNVDFVYGYSMVDYISSSSDSSETGGGILDTGCIFQGIDYSPLGSESYYYSFYDYKTGYFSNYLYFSLCNVNTFCSGYISNTLACVYGSDDGVFHSLGKGNGYFKINGTGVATLTYYDTAFTYQCPDGFRRLNINLIPSYISSSSYVAYFSQTSNCTFDVDVIYYYSIVNYIDSTDRTDGSSSSENNNNNNSKEFGISKCIFNGIDFSPLGKEDYYFYSSDENTQYYINICKISSYCSGVYNTSVSCLYNSTSHGEGFKNLALLDDGYFYLDGNNNTVLSYYSYDQSCPNSFQKLNVIFMASNTSSNDSYILSAHQTSLCVYNIYFSYDVSMVNYININNETSSSSDKENSMVCENVDSNFETLRVSTNLNEVECMVGNNLNGTFDKNTLYCYGQNINSMCFINRQTQTYKCKGFGGDVEVECIGPNVQCKVSQSYCAIKDNKLFIVDGYPYGDSVVNIRPKTSNSILLISNINLIIITLIITFLIILN